MEIIIKIETNLAADLLS